MSEEENKETTPIETEPTQENIDTPPEEVQEPTKEEEKQKQPPEKEPEEPPKIDENDVEGSLKNVGFDYAELQKEFDVNGDITAETRQKLSDVGITGEMVDAYIEGQKARAEKQLDEIAQVIGGREAFDETIQWAAKNLSEEEKTSINAVRDPNVMKMILVNLRGRMEEKEGKLPQYTQGSANPPTTDLFESRAQMYEAIRDPRYNVDPAYREKVAAKIRASREAGKDLGID